MALELKNNYLQFNPNTLEEVRKEYNLDKPGAMEQAIDILHDWAQKQEHFMKKDFSRDYLERFIISSKGSVEKAKTKLDKICTMRTMAPNLFAKYHAKNDFPKLRNFSISVVMPKICEDNYRILIGKMISKPTSPADGLEAHQHCGIFCEYGKLYDYAKGYYLVYDLGDFNIMDIIANMDLVNFRNIVVAAVEGYGFRIKIAYIISSSKMIDVLIKILKQCVSAKMGERIMVLQTAESLHEYLPRQYLPKEYGGEQKSLLDLFDEFNEELSSEKHVAHMKEMRQACTNEALRCSDRFNEEYLGIPGSFKVLSVD